MTDFEVMPIGTKNRLEKLERELEQLRAENAVLVESLGHIVTLYQDPNHDHNWAYCTNHLATTALTNTFQQAKVLLAVKEAARTYIRSMKDDSVKGSLQLLDDLEAAIEAYDKSREGK